MGIFRCEIHGLQGFVEVCAEVDAAIRGGSDLRRNRVLEFDVCDACWKTHDLGRFESESFLDWSDAAAAQYDLLKIGSAIHCIECVAAADLDRARNHGRGDPFPAYEHTLTFLQRETVRQLETELLRSFEFRESIVQRGHRALFVKEGAVTYPLTIEIFYLTSSEVQDSVLRFLATFFEGSSRSQYRVRFYRSEDWIQSTSNPSSWSRGPEELLREVETDPPRARRE